MTKPALRTDADFDAIYERNWKYIYRLCFTFMKSQADAEDCTEDVFVKVLTGNLAFTDQTHERKWLTVTAVNLCKDRLKSFARTMVDSIDDEMAPDIAAPEREDYRHVKDAVMALPPDHKDVIWLYYFEGWSTDEIARMLDRPSSTIRNRLKNARKTLKTLMNEVN